VAYAHMRQQLKVPPHHAVHTAPDNRTFLDTVREGPTYVPVQLYGALLPVQVQLGSVRTPPSTGPKREEIAYRPILVLNP
jgi:hypothetical protein